MSERADRLLEALASTARRDRLVQAAAGTVVLALVLLTVLKALDVALPWSMLMIAVNLVLLVLVLVSLGWRLEAVERAWERSFWKRLIAAYGCWSIGVAGPAALPASAGSVTASAVEVVFSALFYLLMLRALERRPHLPAPAYGTRAERFLTWPSVTFFVLGWMIYFVFIPLARGSTAEANALAVNFYTLIDAYLLFRLLFLARTTTTRRWRTLYLALALPWFFILPADLSFIATSYLPPGYLRSILGWAWILSFVLQVLAVRLRHHPFAKEREPGDRDHRAREAEEPSLVLAARTLALGLAFPVIHVLTYRFVSLDTASENGREMLVLVWLIVFGMTALWQHRVLERWAQKLWLDRLAFEDALASSEVDLRLILQRSRAEGKLQAAEMRFDLAFRACPYALAISRRRDGRLLEVNPAFEGTFGYRSGEAEGRSAEQLGLWGERRDLDHVARRLAAQREVRELEVTARTKAGEERRVLLSAAELELGDEPCVLSILHDVTERRAAERRLEEKAELFDAARGAAPEADEPARRLLERAFPA